MPEFFETVAVKFQDVPTEGGIDVTKFCDASDGLVSIFDVLGNAAFAPVKSDLGGNIKKIRDALAASGKTTHTLQSLVASEGKPGDKNRPATQSLLWLTRGLKFTALGLRNNLSNPSEELAVSFNNSYDKTLKQYHSFLVRPIFSLAMKACPYRKDFYPKLGSPPEIVDKELNEWLAALEKIIVTIEAFYAEGNWGKGF